MRSYGDELQVQQGENFNMDREVFANAQKRIPYIVSSGRVNPYWTITVASTKFEKNLRYVKTWWNKYTGVKFFGTNPVFYGDLSPTVIPPEYNIDLGERDAEPTAFDYHTGEQPGGEGIPSVKIGYDGTPITDYYVDYANNPKVYKVIIDYEAKYYKFNYETLELEEVLPVERLDIPTEPIDDDPQHNYLYYYTLQSDEIDPVTMEKPRYYFYYDYSKGGALTYGYNCTIRQNFSTNETQDWTGQNYMYQITLVDGKLMYLALNELYEAKAAKYPMTDYPLDENGNWQSTLEQQEDSDYHELLARRFDYFKLRWPESFQPDIDRDSPLGTIQVPEPILLPTKLEVYNNLRRLI